MIDYTVTGPHTERERMLDALHKAEMWHERKLKTVSFLHLGPSTNEIDFHRQCQQAIWWAIEQLDDSGVKL